MIKKIFLPLFCVLLLFMSGCADQSAKYITFTSKPNSHYYTDELNKQIYSGKSFTVSVFDTNLYKNLAVETSESSIVPDFFSSLSDEDFLAIDAKPADKEVYRIFIEFSDNTKYLIKVFNSSVISVSPWDGKYEEDIVSMESTPLHYNLMDFCNHIHNEPVQKKTS